MSVLLLPQLPCTFVTPGVEPIQGHVTFGWITDIPVLVRMDLQHPIHGIMSWFISRDLLVECMVGDKNRPYGDGDYTVERGEVSAIITLDNDNGFAQVSFFVEPLIAFIRDTLIELPRGKAETAPLNKLLDEWLENL